MIEAVRIMNALVGILLLLLLSGQIKRKLKKYR